MNGTDAMSRIEALCPPEAEPTLSGFQLSYLLSLAATADAAGLLPSDTGWTPTYSVRGVYRAVKEGWTMKAGLVEAAFDFTTDGQTFNRSQKTKLLADKCEAQVKFWGRKLAQTVTTSDS